MEFRPRRLGRLSSARFGCRLCDFARRQTAQSERDSPDSAGQDNVRRARLDKTPARRRRFLFHTRHRLYIIDNSYDTGPGGWASLYEHLRLAQFVDQPLLASIEHLPGQSVKVAKSPEQV